MQTESYIQSLFAERIGGSGFGKDTKVYKFEKIKRAKAAAREAHPDTPLLDFGVGEPDEMAYPIVRDALKKEVDEHGNRDYADNGILEFCKAAAAYLKNVYKVDVNPEDEVLHAIGSKSALSMMPSAFVDPGDVVLMTVPGYPVFGTHASWYGGQVHNLELREENGFLPDLDSIDRELLDRTKAIVVNYPNNPTGAVAMPQFFEKLVQMANEHQFIVIQDAAYAALSFDPVPLSFLSVDGAKDVGVEIHSMSKAFNMTGWRLAFVAGNPLIVSAFANVKDNYDSGQFKAIQKACALALAYPEITDEIKTKYERRLKGLCDVLGNIGFDATMPRGTFYLYVRIPKATKSGNEFKTAEDFSQYLIREKLISTVPWDDVGNYIRFSATFEAAGEQAEKEILEELGRRLGSVGLVF